MLVLAVSILIIAGVVIMVAGFVLPAHDDRYDSEQLEKEIRELVMRNISGSKRQVQEMVDTVIGDNIGKTTRALERMTNEKIQSISDYSDTVMNEIHKNHDEVVFMFDMLSDKHADLKETAAEVTKVAKEATELSKDAKLSAEETYAKAKDKLDETMLSVQQMEEAKRTELAKELAAIKAYAKQSAQDRLEMERTLSETRQQHALQQMMQQQMVEAQEKAAEEEHKRIAMQKAAEEEAVKRAVMEEQQMQEAQRQRQLLIEAEAAKIEAQMKLQAQTQMQAAQATGQIPQVTGQLPQVTGQLPQVTGPLPEVSSHSIPEMVYLDGQPLPQHEVNQEVQEAVRKSVSIDGQRSSIPEIVQPQGKKVPPSFTRMMQPEAYEEGVWFGDVEPTAAMRRAAMERLRSEEEERQKRLKKTFKPMQERRMKQIDVSRAHVIGASEKEGNGKVVPITSAKAGNAYREMLLAGKDPNDLTLNDHILLMHHQGKSNMAIARELGLGIGEVTLVIDLSKRQRILKDN